MNLFKEILGKLRNFRPLFNEFSNLVVRCSTESLNEYALYKYCLCAVVFCCLTMASQLKTNIRTVVGIIEMVLFSGVIFGWANLVLVLKEEEYFKDLCADSDNGNSSLRKESSDDAEKCGKQDERLALIFTLSVFSFNAAGFIAGALLDKLGTRFVRLIGW